MWLKIPGAYRLVPECVADPKRCGEPMPRYLATLTDEEKSAIRQWIESGATPRWTRYGEW